MRNRSLPVRTAAVNSAHSKDECGSYASPICGPGCVLVNCSHPSKICGSGVTFTSTFTTSVCFSYSLRLKSDRPQSCLFRLRQQDGPTSAQVTREKLREGVAPDTEEDPLACSHHFAEASADSKRRRHCRLSTAQCARDGKCRESTTSSLQSVCCEHSVQ